MKKFKLPTAQTILLLIAALVTVLTWLIPSGKYDQLSYNKDNNTFIIKHLDETSTLPATTESLKSLNINIPLEKFTSGAIYKAINIPGTYQEVTGQPQGLFAFLQAPIKGIIATADIIFLVLIIGGLIGIMNLTGAFDAGISRLSNLLKGREYWLIIAVTTLVAAGGTTFGLAEETIAFFPILVPVFIAAKYDAMVGLACIFMGSSIGTMCSTTNPFSTIIASNSAGIQWTDGLIGRAIMLAICLIVSMIYMIRYANRVKNDPTKSFVYEDRKAIEQNLKFDTKNAPKLTPRLQLILVVFTLSFIVMIIGVSTLDWWFTEMTTTFLIAAIIIGFIGKLKEEAFVDSFATGAGSLLSVAFIIGIARGISILMDDGLISDTLLFHASSITEGMSKGVFINSMLFTYGGLSFFIPSSSGMAVLTMPIMAPLGDTVGVGRALIVNAYEFGMGLFNLINPTGLILASLAVVKIGFDKWLKFIMPLLLILIAITMIGLTIMVYI
ncbi:YfcC family protein [Flavobacteriaceae bacterium F08102]|nr:YfcC family protein [Flavobacteriaceae bacterium F08102]